MLYPPVMETNVTACSGQNWRFDGSTITVCIPITWKRRGGRKVVIAPDGGDAWAPAKPRPDETLMRALAVSFEEVVHSALTGDAEVAKLQ